MSSFHPLPLGQRMPDRPHAVSVSLPTMRDVIGYEEKDPEIIRHIASGYPRFVQPPAVRELAARVTTELGLHGHTLWLCASDHAVGRLLDHLASPHAVPVTHREVHGVAHREDPELYARAKAWLQHTGRLLSSRAAEDALAARRSSSGARRSTDPVADTARVLAQLTPLLAPATAADITLTASGMSAVWAAFRAVAEVQGPRGRDTWLQLGWLYLDTIAILQKFTGGGERCLQLDNVNDHTALAQVFREHGSRLAGVITEVPTNPLVHTSDLTALAALCRAHGVHLTLDPSLQSVFNVDVLGHADVLVTSLTKYTASEGDVIAGLVAVNPDRPDAAALRAALPAHAEALYPRELARLAAQIDQTADVVARINATTPRVVAFLRGHPAIAEVWWSLRDETRDAYHAVARSPAHVGGVISFAVRGPVARFYDRVRLPKGPSFGLQMSLLCPFIYLAHYDLVTSPAGQARLRAAGIPPELLRLGLGCEPVDDILAALDEALA